MVKNGKIGAEKVVPRTGSNKLGSKTQVRYNSIAKSVEMRKLMKDKILEALDFKTLDLSLNDTALKSPNKIRSHQPDLPRAFSKA